MQVCRLQLNNFRNYRELDLVPGERLNILYGENAQGKSNVLEAFSLLATTRSCRAGRESEMIFATSKWRMSPRRSHGSGRAMPRSRSPFSRPTKRRCGSTV